jgi:hypothetical protein
VHDDEAYDASLLIDIMMQGLHVPMSWWVNINKSQTKVIDASASNACPVRFETLFDCSLQLT